MTAQEVDERIHQHPALCQTWETALPFENEGGMLYLSSILRAEESVGTVHVCVWDKAALGKPLLARKSALELMRKENLDRLVGEINYTNRLALNYAKKVGFNTIGIVRSRKDAHGEPHDVVLVDALPGDLTWA